MRLAETALSTLGFAPVESGQPPEEEPDRSLTRADFRAQDSGSGILTSRVWNSILAVGNELRDARCAVINPDISAEQRKLRDQRLRELAQFEGLLSGGQVSLRKLKELEQTGAFLRPGFGSGSRVLIGKVAALGFEV